LRFDLSIMITDKTLLMIKYRQQTNHKKTTFTVKDLLNNFNRRILTFYSDASYSYENESSQQTLDMSGDNMTDL